METADKGYRIEIIRSKRRTVAFQIKGPGLVVVRAPVRVSRREIEALLQANSARIEAALEKYRSREAENPRLPVLTEKELADMKRRASSVISARAVYFANLMNVSFGRITVRSQKTLWGSCSGKRNLNFNCLLMLVPDDILDYVVVHELCHLKEMNHSAAFWAEVGKVLPDYRERRKWLKENGGAILKRLP